MHAGILCNVLAICCFELINKVQKIFDKVILHGSGTLQLSSRLHDYNFSKAALIRADRVGKGGKRQG